LPVLVIAGMLFVSARGLRRGERDYFYTVPEVSFYELRGLNGKHLFVPRTGDQCWDHKLPCTPYIGLFPLQRIKWPANWPAPPSDWTPDDPLGIGKKGGLPE